MEPRIIKSEEQHRQALHEVERLAAREPDVDSVEGARLELFAKLVDDYERERYPFARPDPVAAILFRMEQQGLRQKDVAHALGGKNRASEVLARKRPLTLAMIRRLVDEFAMSPALLIREPGCGLFDGRKIGQNCPVRAAAPQKCDEAWRQGRQITLNTQPLSRFPDRR